MMEEITIKKEIKVLFLACFLLFIFNKTFIRKWILNEEVPKVLELISYSIPNFFEAILGTLILTAIFLRANMLFWPPPKSEKAIFIYILVFSISAIYVISQELNYHALGGVNIYDPNDILASVLGLLFSFFFILKVGFYDLITTSSAN